VKNRSLKKLNNYENLLQLQWSGTQNAFFIIVMDLEKIKSILSLLEQYELTLREKQFVEAVEKYFNRNGKITDQQESVLEGIYKEKIWIRKAFFSQNNLLIKGSSSKAA
jgi:hypothetical protein